MPTTVINVKNNFYQAEVGAVKNIFSQIGSPKSQALVNKSILFSSFVANARQVLVEGKYSDPGAEIFGSTVAAVASATGEVTQSVTRTTPQVFCGMLKIDPNLSEPIIQELAEMLREHQSNPFVAEELSETISRLSEKFSIPEEAALGFSVALQVLGSPRFDKWESERRGKRPDELLKEARITSDTIAVWKTQYEKIPKFYPDEIASGMEAGTYTVRSKE